MTTTHRRTISQRMRAQERPTQPSLPACPPVELEDPEARPTAPYPTRYSVIDEDSAICREVIRTLNAHDDDRAILITKKAKRRPTK